MPGLNAEEIRKQKDFVTIFPAAPPALHVRAILVVLCQSLAQMEGALRKVREVLQAYERGDWAKLEAIIRH